MNFFRTVRLRCKRGQALIEITLIFPMLVALSFGAIEVGNLIYAYQVIHHVTAQGANIAARLDSGTTVDALLSQVVDAACPLLSQGTTSATNCPPSNASRWRVIYTEMGPDTSAGEPQPYIVREQRVLGSGQMVASKRLCAACGSTSPLTCDPASGACIQPDIPNANDIAAGQRLYAVEVFYDYRPITALGNFLLGSSVGSNFAGILYERSIF